MTTVGFQLVRTVPPEQLPELARRLEPAVDELWVIEDLPFAGGISQLLAVLDATEQVVVGHGIAPAPFRNPCALAMEWATAARIHPSRVRCGIGHGVPEWMRRIGDGVDSPVTLLAETITATRTLLRGERLDVDGRYVSIRDVTLEFPPDPVPPVLAGVRGPRSLEAAGRVADGVILAETTGPDDVRVALGLIDRGRRALGRDVANVGGRAGVADGGASGGMTRPIVTVFCWARWGEPVALPAPGFAAQDPDPDAVAADLRDLVAAGVDHLVLTPLGRPDGPDADSDVLDQYDRLAADVIPRLRL